MQIVKLLGVRITLLYENTTYLFLTRLKTA